ncbi:MAG: Lysophospholipase [Pseudobdellovibrio sp.]|jgi:acylglycerol lipase|nr:Lysophospholipase [Pseudobdellovibrio sp.]
MKNHLKILISFVVALAISGCASAPYQSGLAPAIKKEANNSIGRFKTDDGLKLFAQWWTPAPGPSKAAVIIVHGLKDHSRRYAETAQKLTQSNYSVYAFDLRGHGDSEGQRVWVDSFDQYVNDLQTFYDLVQKKEPNKPIFIFGHSMGGAIVTLFSLRKSRPVAGLVLSGPALQLDVASITTGSTKYLVSPLLPTLAVLKLNEEDFSRDPKVVAEINNDPLIYHGAGPAKTAAELFKAVDTIRENMAKVETPFIALHGQQDKLTMYEGSADLFQISKAKGKALKLYQQAYHDLLHEPEKEKVYGDMLAWLEGRMASPAPAVSTTPKQ